MALRFLRVGFIALLALSVLQAIAYYPQLPEQMASHFDGAGHPNGWSSRGQFFAIMIGVNILMAAIFLFTPYLVHRRTRQAISLPHRDYWLAPERIDGTVAFLRTGLLWMGIATLLFMMGITQLTISANLDGGGHLSGQTQYLLIAYLVFTGVWMVFFVGRFLRVPRA